jgi:hypothetical protein
MRVKKGILVMICVFVLAITATCDNKRPLNAFFDIPMRLV